MIVIRPLPYLFLWLCFSDFSRHTGFILSHYGIQITFSIFLDNNNGMNMMGHHNTFINFDIGVVFLNFIQFYFRNMTQYIRIFC